jgi:hypothetical protein
VLVIETSVLVFGQLDHSGSDGGSRRQVVEDHDSALLSSVHDDPAIHGVTESLFASGVTDSLYSHTSKNNC